MFQVAYALQSIYDVYPNFRHNDLSLKNILMERVSKRKTPKYDKWNNKSFEIPNIGCEIKDL